jgi:hypothetical protein
MKALLLPRRVTLTLQEEAARRQWNKERATFRRNRRVGIRRKATYDTTYPSIGMLGMLQF